LPSFGAEVEPLVASHTRRLGALMRGNLDWSLDTERYRGSVPAQTKAAPGAGA
jgi:hypothetical protein